ncbi:MAG: hypothetical protein WCS77_00590 [Elusimicrobiaceae bacterium]
MIIKKRKVALRTKVKKQRRKRLFFVFVFAIFAGLLVYQARVAVALATSISVPQWARWKLEKVTVRCSDAELSAQISAYKTFEKGVQFSGADCKAYAQGIKEQFPFLKDVRVSRDWITHELIVVPTLRAPVAKTPDGLFVDADGSVYQPNAAAAAENCLVLLPETAGAPLDKAVVGLAADIKENFTLFPSPPVTLVYAGARAVSLEFADGTKVKWSESGTVREKALRIAQVYNKTAAKFPAPYRIDLTYFDDGKILLAEAAVR